MSVMDNYLVRRPALKVEVLDSIFNTDEELETVLSAYLSQDQIKERILIASPSLYQQLLEGKFTAGARLSLVKYLLRMSSRTMPFGLFSGISSRKFSGSELEQHAADEKKVRLSIKWYKKFITVIEDLQSIESEMKVSLNPLVEKNNLHYSLDVILQNNFQQVKIKKAPLIESLVNHSISPIKIVDLLNRIVPEDTEKKELCLKTVKNLLKNQFLVSELQPSVYYEKGDALLQKLIAHPELLGEEFHSAIRSISTMIEIYKGLKVGEGMSVYKDIISKMKELVESDKYLVIDSIFRKQGEEESELDRKDIETMVKDLSLLANLSQQFTASAWDHYYLQFIDKYGFFNEVQLMELLDSDKGIGLPSFQNQQPYSEQDEDFMAYMLDKLWNNQGSNQTVLELHEEDMKAISAIYQSNRQHKLKDGYDMKFSIVEENGKKLFHLGVNSFGNTASSFSGRLDTEQHQETAPYYSDDHYVSCELNGVPINYPDLGISYKKPDFLIDITCKSEQEDHVIQLSDVYVGADTGGFYLKSRRLQKRLLPVSTHMLYYNNFLEQRPLLFLSLFGKYISDVPTNIGLGRLKTLKYLPRIQYKNIILSPRRWNLPLEELKAEPRQLLTKLVEEYSLTEQYVYLLDGDKTLPVLLHTTIGQELVIDAIKKAEKYSNYLTLVEAPELNDTISNNRHFMKDYIVTVPPTAQHTVRNVPSQDVGTHEKLIDHEWTYYQIYYHQNHKQAVLTSCLESLYKRHYSQVFYINYQDFSGQPHLRIRYKKALDSKDPLVEILEDLRMKELVKDYSSHLFEPEYSRYGGNPLAKEAYVYFCHETKVGFQLNLQKEWQMTKETEQGIMSMLMTVLDLHDSYEGAASYLEHLHLQANTDGNFLKKFKSNRNYYTALGNRAVDLYKEHQHGLFKEKKEAGRRYASKVNQQFSTERRNYIFNSLIHMTLNRVIGINKQLEDEVNCLVHYIFYNLKFRLQMKGEYDELI